MPEQVNDPLEQLFMLRVCSQDVEAFVNSRLSFLLQEWNIAS